MSRRIARPYAAALFGVLAKKEPGTLRQVEGELEAVAQAFAADPRLLRLFEVPSVPPAKKRQILEEIGRALELSTPTRRLLAALEQHMRLRFLPEVVAAFRELVDRREGMTRGSVTLPAPVSPEHVAALAKALESMVGGRVELEPRVKPELLAGFVVRMGSRVFDGSLRAQLARFAALRQAGR